LIPQAPEFYSDRGRLPTYDLYVPYLTPIEDTLLHTPKYRTQNS